MSQKSYKQTAYETCLAVALMLLTDVKPSKAKELSIWKSGWSFNFLIGQTNHVCEKYHKRLALYIENKIYFNSIKKQKVKNIQLECKRVSPKLIAKIVQSNKLIIYLDNFYLQKIVHAPHFVMIESSHKQNYVISDPWDGTQKLIAKKLLHKAISSLRTHLKYSPVLIYQKRE